MQHIAIEPIDHARGFDDRLLVIGVGDLVHQVTEEFEMLLLYEVGITDFCC